MKIGFVGATHLGICYSAAISEKGYKVTCYDSDFALIQNLNNLQVPFYEKRLKNILKKKKVEFTSNVNKLNNCELVFISKDVPTNDQNISNFKIINHTFVNIKKKLKKNCIVIFLSQVYPGFTEKIKWKKKQLFYQVETLIFGKAIERAKNPEQIILGYYSKVIPKKLKMFYQKFTKNLQITDLKTAELSKITINLYLISTITFANYMSAFCEKFGTDFEFIENILRKDKRVGKYSYIKPGLGILSGNLQRDLQNFSKLVKRKRFNPTLSDFWINYSKLRSEWVINTLKKIFKKTKINEVGLVGLTYKEDISILKNSPAIKLVKKFNKIFFYYYDEKIKLKDEYNNMQNVKDIKTLISKVKILILLTPYKKFQNKNYLNYFKKFNGSI
jgi:UDPglucose 6-dehydrogenase